MENTKKLLSELTREELRELFKKNEWLRKQASEQAQNDVNFWIDEVLAPFRKVKSIDFEFGCYKVFRVKYQENYTDFIDALEKADKDFCILYDDEISKIYHRTKDKIDFFDDCLNGYEDICPERYYNLEKWIDNNIKALCSFIWDYIDGEIDYSYSNEAAENALDCLIENIGDAYTTDGSLIYEINYRKYA